MGGREEQRDESLMTEKEERGDRKGSEWEWRVSKRDSSVGVGEGVGGGSRRDVFSVFGRN